MLPSQLHNQYQAFQQQLEALHQEWSSLSKPELEAAIADLQQSFQDKILTLNEALLDAAIAHQVRSYQTEIHKQLQLLKMDASFWLAARQPDKRTQRFNQISGRFTTLIRYVDTVQGL